MNNKLLIADPETIYTTADGIYSDIDIYACAIAYAELLTLEGKKAIALINTNYTESVTSDLKKLSVKFIDQDTVDLKSLNKIVILDRSDSGLLDDHFSLDKVIEIYDHHSGFEGYWQGILGENAHIEPVGSCATLVWEEFQKRNFVDKISDSSATLLLAAIASNTLNFQSSVTTDRDRKAYQEIQQKLNLPSNFIENYFEAVSQGIISDPIKAAINDTKNPVINNEIIVISQLELWDAKEILPTIEKDYPAAIIPFSIKNGGEDRWFMTIASISDNCNYFYCQNSQLKEKLTVSLNVEWNGDLGQTKKLWLRKEITKALSKP